MLRLGELIDRLAAVDQDKSLVFDWDNRYPGGVDSWRGHYTDLAISPVNHEHPGTVREFRLVLEDALDRMFEGYKGGYYWMNENSLVWVAPWGHSTPAYKRKLAFFDEYVVIVDVVETDVVTFVTDISEYIDSD